MRFIVLPLLVAISVPPAVAQERWQQLAGAAEAYAVDLQSLARKGEVLSARIRTHDVGSRFIVQRVQVRCTSSQLRTIGEELYNAETGRSLSRTQAGSPEEGGAWPEYETGSEGHAVLSGLCALARKQNLIGLGQVNRRNHGEWTRMIA